jgi:hypothetical protein
MYINPRNLLALAMQRVKWRQRHAMRLGSSFSVFEALGLNIPDLPF